MFSFTRLQETAKGDNWNALLVRLRVPTSSHPNAWSYQFDYDAIHTTEAEAQADADNQLAGFMTMIPSPLQVRTSSAQATQDFERNCWHARVRARGWSA
jgi:hypothetical protein